MTFRRNPSLSSNVLLVINNGMIKPQVYIYLQYTENTLTISSIQALINSLAWARELTTPTRPSNLRMSAKLVTTFFRIEGATWPAWRIPYARILGFLDRSITLVEEEIN
jgi:hypothetical protein